MKPLKLDLLKSLEYSFMAVSHRAYTRESSLGKIESFYDFSFAPMRCYYSHLTSGESECQRYKVNYARSHHESAYETELETWRPLLIHGPLL